MEQMWLAECPRVSLAAPHTSCAMGSPSEPAPRCLGCIPATQGEAGSAAGSPWQQSWAHSGGVLGGIAPLKHVPRPGKVPAIRRVRVAWGWDLPPSKPLICLS